MEARPPLRVNRIELCGPSLFRISLGALTRFLQRLLVALSEAAQMGIELSLKFGANGVNHAATLFLGH
jgi:hypothetical protein